MSRVRTKRRASVQVSGTRAESLALLSFDSSATIFTGSRNIAMHNFRVRNQGDPGPGNPGAGAVVQTPFGLELAHIT